MELADAIRKRRAVRTYTDKPVDDEVLDRILRLALRAPTGGGQQAWGLMLVRDAEKRREVAELIIRGGAQYFALMRPQKDATDEEHAAWAREYAEGVMATYRHVPAFVVGLLVPRGYPEGFPGGYEDDLISLAFAFENLMLAAREQGLGSVPITAFHRWEKDRLRELLGIPAEVDPAIVSPIGYPEAFPTGLAPALKRNFRSWRALVHDDTYGNTRE
ncbi:nitroreductase family protein [Miltoncostaea marina]|uniref:nitroreductase family protein n=1 Tax=Miltoncostaea marina TaxID=2843215 RepID=UPI001C3E1377|nr:nitroreductase family protein [Miltoncostaea marina]